MLFFWYLERWYTFSNKFVLQYLFEKAAGLKICRAKLIPNVDWKLALLDVGGWNWLILYSKTLD